MRSLFTMTRRDCLVALAAVVFTLGTAYSVGALRPVMGTAIFRWDEAEVERSDGFAERVFASNATSTLLNLEVRGVTLDPGTTPHPARPHAQTEEQLVLVRSGSLRVELGTVRPTTAGGVEEKVRVLGAGDVLFLAANQEHALVSVGEEPAVYHAIEWRSPGMQGGKESLSSQP